MIDFKNFKIKRGPTADLHDPRLIVEEGYWYLSTDKAELFIGIVENGTPVLKPINGELIPKVNLEGYATEDFVREAIKNIDIPEVELYDDTELRNLINSKADKEHTHEEYSLIDHKHAEYLTEHQDLSHLALKEHEHSEYITEHQSLEHLALKEHKHDEYLTEHQSLEGYAKTADLFSKDYNDLTNKPEIPSIEGLASETYVQTEIGKIKFPETDLSNYYTKEEVDVLLPVEEIEEVKTKVETVLLPKVEEEIEPTVAELKAWVDANNEIQDIILAKVGEDLNILENNIGYVKVDDRSFAEVIDETFAKKSEIPSLEEYAKLEDVPSVEGLATEDFVKEEINKIEHPANPTKVSELENDANYTNETKVLELIENNASSKIGIDFTTNITIGGLHAGTTITKDMTIGQLLYRMLYCEHDFVAVECGKPMICDYCGAEGPIAEHDPRINEGHEATCGSAGRTDEIYCGRCGEILEPAEEIPALVHIPSSSLDYSEEPTCTEVGYIKTRCELCGDVVDIQEVPALGHEFVDGICIRCGEVDPNYNPDQPEVPEGILGEIISNDLQMYVVNNDGSLESVPFEINKLSEEQAAQEPTKSGFYQVITNEGNTLEYGYNDLSIANQDWVYMVALPKSIKEENISVQTFSDEEQIWEDNTFELTCDLDTVNDICDIYGMDISSVDIDKYTVWASVTEQPCTGSKIRYVITE